MEIKGKKYYCFDCNHTLHWEDTHVILQFKDVDKIFQTYFLQLKPNERIEIFLSPNLAKACGYKSYILVGTI